MTNEQINRAVAEELGWKHNGHGAWHKNGQVRGLVAEDLEEFGYVEALPNYAEDYTAVAEMRKAVKPDDETDLYICALQFVVACGGFMGVWSAINATPRQQCEAFLRMRGKWVE